MANYGVCEDIEPSGSFDNTVTGGGVTVSGRSRDVWGLSVSLICYTLSALLKWIRKTSCYQRHSSNLTEEMKVQFKDLHAVFYLLQSLKH